MKPSVRKSGHCGCWVMRFWGLERHYRTWENAVRAAGAIQRRRKAAWS